MKVLLPFHLKHMGKKTLSSSLTFSSGFLSFPSTAKPLKQLSQFLFDRKQLWWYSTAHPLNCSHRDPDIGYFWSPYNITLDPFPLLKMFFSEGLLNLFRLQLFFLWLSVTSVTFLCSCFSPALIIDTHSLTRGDLVASRHHLCPQF